MILLTSAAYIDTEFQAEFGKLPPSFLPVGNRRLFEHQIAFVRKIFPVEPVYLSLPANFDLPEKDGLRLRELGVEIIFVPEGLPLADSLLHVLNTIGIYEGLLRLLHGDTLIELFPGDEDSLGVSRTQDFYNWEVEITEDVDILVWCGYFSFSDIRLLVRSLAMARGNFVVAVRHYDEQQPLKRSNIERWHDFGHVNSYYKARASITTERSFNQLEIRDGCVRKSGNPAKKIIAEAEWFARLPSKLKRFTPQLIEVGIDGQSGPYYILEYLCLAPLNEMYVHGRHPVYFWSRIFDHAQCWINLCVDSAQKYSTGGVRRRRDSLIRIKTLERIAQFPNSLKFDLDRPARINGCLLPSIRDIATDCIRLATDAPSLPGVLHGDLCFSNMLFDLRSDTLKVIDPRGVSPEDCFDAMVGDLAYDIAKLNHSVVGLYDFIIAGAFRCTRLGPSEFEFDIQVDSRVLSIQEQFMRRQYGEISPLQVMPLTVLLFISMAPLHADRPDRQIALLANGLRLYAEYLMKN